MEDDIILTLSNITKVFPGVKALDKVSFSLRRGEIHALVGENGAGKSTLMHVLSGLHIPEEGSIAIDGKEHKFRRPNDAKEAGIGIVFQELSLVPQLSVAENIFINKQPLTKLKFIDYKKMYKNAKKYLDMFNEKIDPRIKVKDLSIAKQQVVEIIKAISKYPQIFILK